MLSRQALIQPCRQVLPVVALWMGATGAIVPTAGVYAAEPASGNAASRTVRVVIDYGDGAQLHVGGIAWQAKMTALDALVAIQKHRHGVSSSVKGKGSGAMVTQIGDLKNEGGGAKSRNWLFQVNGKQVDVGAGAYELEARDTVLWKFGLLE